MDKFDEAIKEAVEFWEKVEEKYNEPLLRNIISYLQNRFIRHHLKRDYEKKKKMDEVRNKEK